MKTLRTSPQSSLPSLAGKCIGLRRPSPIRSACLLLVMMSTGVPVVAQQTAPPKTPAEAKVSEENWLAAQIRMFRAYPHLHRAYRQIDQNDLAGAEESLENYLELDPQDLNARVSLLHVLFRQKKYTNMVSHADRILKRDPEHVVAHLYRALGKQTAGNTEEALASYTRVYQNERASREDRRFAASSAADIALRQKRNSEGLVALTLLQSLDNNFNVNYRRGLVLEALGNLDEAHQSHQVALSKASNTLEKIEAHSALGYVLGRMGRTKDAIEHGGAVLKLSPDNAEWPRSLANLHYSAKDYAAAETLARRAVQTGKGAEDRQILGNILMAREKYREAAQWFEPVANSNADPALRYQAAMGLGYALGGAGNQTGARDAFALALSIHQSDDALKALELTNRNLDAMQVFASSGGGGAVGASGSGFAMDPSTLGQKLAQRGQFDKAVKTLEQGLKAGGDPALRLQLAEVLASRGDIGRATREVARFEPRTNEQRRRVADVYARVGDAPKAIAYLKPAATTAEARLQLGQYYLEVGQPEQALGALNAVLENKAQPAERVAALRQAAYVQARLGNETEALRLFQQALGQGDTAPETHKEVAYLFTRLGRHHDAINQLANLPPDAIGPDILLLTARSYTAIQRPADAARYYEAASATAERLPSAEQAALYAELGHYYSEQGRFEQAHDNWVRASLLHDDPAMQQSLAYAEEMLGRPGDAIGRLVKLAGSLADQRQQAILHDQLARLYEMQGDTTRAATAAEQALALGSTPERHYHRAMLAMKLQDQVVARRHLERATDAAPDNAEYAQQLAYVCKSQKDTPCAVRMFENVVRIDPNRSEVFEDLAYSYTEGGNNERAVEWFKRAIDTHLNKRQMQALVSYLQEPAGINPQTGAPVIGGAAASGEEDRVHRLRQQVRDMSRRYQFNVYQSYRSNTNSGTSDVTPGFQTGGLIPSQGGVEFLYQPPGIGYQDGRTFRTFARMLWSNRPDSLRINSETLQGGVGVEYKPFREQNIYVSMERLIKVGDQSQDNWLARASWGFADGYELKPGQASWNHTIVYADVGYLLQREKTKSVFAELRQGRSYNYLNKAMITPHITVAGRGQRPDPADASYLEVGAGVAVKAFYNETRYEAPRSSAELVVQYRKPVNNERTGGWVMAAALQF